MALFGLFGGKKTSVGLDIGSGIIKLVVIDHGGSEAELTKVATTEVAADAIVEGEVMDPGLVSEAIRGLLEAAKRELVESRVGLLTEAGLDPSVIDVDAFAIHNAFELNHPDAMQGVVGLVNIGHEVTNVNILEDGIPVLTRDLSVGTRRFREDLQREKGLASEEAEKVIQGSSQHADLAGYVSARGEEIAVGVERAAAFLATASRSAGGLSRVYTTGGGARIPGLNDVLGARLKVAIELANPVQRLRVRDDVFETVPVDEVAPLLMLAVGLALRRAA